MARRDGSNISTASRCCGRRSGCTAASCFGVTWCPVRCRIRSRAEAAPGWGVEVWFPAEGLLGERRDGRGHASPRHGADLLRELGDEPAVGEACRFRQGVAAGGAPGAAAVDAVDAQAAQVRDLQLPGRPELELWTPAAHAGVRIDRRLCNLNDLQKIGFAANRRLLGVQRISHRCQLGTEVFDGLHRPAVIDDRRVSALRFGDPRVQALLATLLAFRLLSVGFANRQLREYAAPLLGLSLDAYGPARATYDLRRLRTGIASPSKVCVSHCATNMCSVARSVQRCPRSSTRTSLLPSADSSSASTCTSSACGRGLLAA